MNLHRTLVAIVILSVIAPMASYAESVFKPGPPAGPLRGALIGALVGAPTVFLVTQRVSDNCSNQGCGIGTLATGAVLGAVVGATVAAVRLSAWKPRRSSDAEVLLDAGPRHGGVGGRLTVRF